MKYTWLVGSIMAVLSGLCIGAESPKYAVRWYVTPNPGTNENFQVTVQSGGLPDMQVGQAFSIDLKSLVQVSGVSGIDPLKLNFVPDQLPAGWAVSPAGLLTGTPSSQDKNPIGITVGYDGRFYSHAMFQVNNYEVVSSIRSTYGPIYSDPVFSKYGNWGGAVPGAVNPADACGNSYPYYFATGGGCTYGACSTSSSYLSGICLSKLMVCPTGTSWDSGWGKCATSNQYGYVQFKVGNS